MTTTTATHLPRGYTDPMSKTPAEWRAEATRCHEEKVASWERSDSDGFLSQWASDQMAHRYLTLARLAEQGGQDDLLTLCNLDGNPIEGARYVETRYGWSWVYEGPTGSVWCRESDHRNPATARERNRAKGFDVLPVMQPVVQDRGGFTVRDPR